MPPMATASVKRKWSDVFEDGESYDKQSIMDLCASKLRYVNPARPPRRRTEVPLLRNVLIVNTMKHLSAELKTDKPVEDSTEDLSVDPGHFEGLPPLSELLTDIMLDPQPSEQAQQHSVGSTFGWTTPNSSTYPSLTPLEPSIPSYMVTADSSIDGGEEEKIVHDLLPCTSVIGMDPAQHTVTWESSSDPAQHSTSWQVQDTTCPHPSSWETSSHSGVLDCFLSSASIQQSTGDSLDSLTPDLAFQSSNGPLPSFNSVFENPQSSSFVELLQTSLLPTCTPPASPGSGTSSTPLTSFPPINGASTEDLVGNVNLTESELELLAMTFSSKLPHMSFEDLVHALPQASLLQQNSQPSQTFYVPSSLPTSVSATCDTAPTANNQCASYCRKDQPPPSVEDSGMVRVLVNL